MIGQASVSAVLLAAVLGCTPIVAPQTYLVSGKSGEFVCLTDVRTGVTECSEADEAGVSSSSVAIVGRSASDLNLGECVRANKLGWVHTVKGDVDCPDAPRLSPVRFDGSAIYDIVVTLDAQSAERLASIVRRIGEWQLTDLVVDVGRHAIGVDLLHPEDVRTSYEELRSRGGGEVRLRSSIPR